jgi:hypothetical protein
MIGVPMVELQAADQPSGGDGHITLPFSCPLRATKSGKRPQVPAQGESSKSPDSTGDPLYTSRSGMPFSAIPIPSR